MDPVVVLFVHRQSIYMLKRGTDCWDRRRDARRFAGEGPVIAHPPCRTWGSLSHLANAPTDEHEMALWARDTVRRCGGVMEHPQRSRMFGKEGGLPMPGDPPDAWGGWTLLVDQFDWGHKASNPTHLYIVGTRDVPAMPAKRTDTPKFFTCSNGSRLKKHKGSPGWRPCLHEPERSATPPAFADWLLALARLCKHNKALTDSGLN